MNDFAHLSADARERLSLDKEERARYMLTDRLIEHARLRRIIDQVDFLVLRPVQPRAGGLIVTGAAGSGKTSLARATLNRFPPRPPADNRPQQLRAVMISMTEARESRVLYTRLLIRLGCPDPSRYSGADRERMAVKLCREAGLRLLIIDEIQDILTSTARQQRGALDTIKFLMNELDLPMLVLGTPDAIHAMELDQHLNARFDRAELPIWKTDNLLVEFLRTLETTLPLREPSLLSSQTIMTTLVELSRGVLHRLVRLVTTAAAHAVEKGEEKVTPALIRLANEQPPIACLRLLEERRREIGLAQAVPA